MEFTSPSRPETDVQKLVEQPGRLVGFIVPNSKPIILDSYAMLQVLPEWGPLGISRRRNRDTTPVAEGQHFERAFLNAEAWHEACTRGIARLCDVKLVGSSRISTYEMSRTTSPGLKIIVESFDEIPEDPKTEFQFRRSVPQQGSADSLGGDVDESCYEPSIQSSATADD